MTEAEYLVWHEQAVVDFAADKVRCGQWSADQAQELALAAFGELLPQGPETPGHELWTIVDGEGAAVGVLWHAVTTQFGQPVEFVYDLRVRPDRRRRGHARRALAELARKARRKGVLGISLHVFGHNAGAIELYRTIGFEPTNLSLFKSFDAAWRPAGTDD
jgi:ribosomal protein S18 acetylase RimI-like enzyme